MALEGKKDTDKWFPVRLVDATDLVTPETGVAFGDVTVVFGFEAATSESSYTVLTGDWKEQGSGNYWLNIGASEFTSEGKYVVNVVAAVATEYNFVVEVQDIDGKGTAEALKIISAVMAGEISGAGSGTEVFKGLDGSTTRATVTVDTSGNRTGVTY